MYTVGRHSLGKTPYYESYVARSSVGVVRSTESVQYTTESALGSSFRLAEVEIQCVKVTHRLK